MSLPVLGWASLVTVLLVATLGVYKCLLMASCLAMTAAGALLVVYVRGLSFAQAYWNLMCTSRLPLSYSGIRKIEEVVLKPARPRKIDKRLTGSSIIDEPLQEVLQYTLRDYVHTWYGLISDEGFLDDLREAAQNIIIAFSNRAKEVEWVPYLTTRLVDDVASHLRLFRMARQKMREKKREEPKQDLDLCTLFFDLETEMENNLCRDMVCTSPVHEKDYLQDLSEVILYLLLPPGDFHNKPFRYLARELLVNIVFLPTLELFSDPDYINQTILWLCKDIPITSEGFLTIVRITDNLEELMATRDKVKTEIAVQRSKDSGGDGDAEIKQQLSSLLFVMKTVDIRLKRLQEGIDTDSTGQTCSIDWNKLTTPGYKLFSLPLDVVLKNNVALSYFIDFMTSIGGHGYLHFYLNVEGYRVSAEQRISAAHLLKLASPDANISDLETLREAALNIHEQYLSEKAACRLKVDDQTVRTLLCRIQTEAPTENWFDDIQSKVLDIMQEDRYFPAFKKSSSYIKLLAELDLLKDNYRSDDEDGQSVDELQLNSYDSLSLSSLEETGSETSSITGLMATSTSTPPLGPDTTLTVNIIEHAVIKESTKSYALYAIEVTRRDGAAKEEHWQVYRRYSDFHDFHTCLIEKFGSQMTINFPGKKTFNNMSSQFLDKRLKLLNEYLQSLLNLETLKNNPGLLETIYHFLVPVPYEKNKGQIARKVDTLKNSVRNMSHVVRSVPDNIIHSMDGMRDGLSRALHDKLHGNIKSGSSSDSSKVAAGLDIDGDDNIPLRIMLLLMDEIFDLKSRNQWLRRRIVTILRQIIKATFGDRINRKIIDSVGWLTSAKQVAEYVKAFKQAFWPNGTPALPSPVRDENTKMRTRVAAKAAMICSLSDELKHFIGNETTRKGVILVFDMLQQRTLNKRLVYVLLEGIMESLFPNNKFQDIFRKLHSRSTRVRLKGEGIHQQ